MVQFLGLIRWPYLTPSLWPGVALGIALIAGSAEFAGPLEEAGRDLAGKLVPIAYGLWSIWLLAAGATLLIG